MEKKQERRKEKGITLVALVVTIIVLIILAGVTLNIVLDQNGIINKAQQATEDYDTAQREEQELLGVVEDYIEYAGKTAPIPEGYTASQITTEDDVAEGLVIYEIPEGATVDWENQTITIEGSTTNLQQTVDQYVWIPVSEINDMVMCKSNNKLAGEDGNKICNLVYDEEADTLTCQTHTDTPTDLVGRLYTSSRTGSNPYSYIMDFTKRDQTYDESNYHEPNTVSFDADNGLELSQLESDFTTMAKSVAKNGGFYISRYEVGAKGDSKKNQQVLTADDANGSNYLGANMWYGLYNTLRENNKPMIWGCQYDQVIKFIGEEAQIGHNDRNLTTDHALSGQNELDEMKNIYDLEGNHNEWTAEALSTSSRARRGSNYSTANNGRFNPASFRNDNLPTLSSNYYSARSTLYL